MNGSQTVVGTLGAALIVGDFWTRDRTPVTSGLGSTSGAAATTGHAAMKRLGIEAATVGVMVIVAGISPSAGGLMAAVLLALALVWAMKYYGGGK